MPAARSRKRLGVLRLTVVPQIPIPPIIPPAIFGLAVRIPDGWLSGDSSAAMPSTFGGMAAQSEVRSSMPKSPLERAARALCELDNNPPCATMDGRPLWMDYLPEARAVLRAVREPSRVMTDAGGEVEYAGESDGEDVNVSAGNYAAGVIYRAMIDAALAERVPPSEPVERAFQPGGFQTKVVR